MEISDPNSSLLAALLQQAAQPADSTTVPGAAAALTAPGDTVTLSDEAKILQQALLPVMQAVLQAGSQDAAGNALGAEDPLVAALTGNQAAAAPSGDPLVDALLGEDQSNASLLDTGLNLP